MAKVVIIANSLEEALKEIAQKLISIVSYWWPDKLKQRKFVEKDEDGAECFLFPISWYETRAQRKNNACSKLYSCSHNLIATMAFTETTNHPVPRTNKEGTYCT